MFGQTGQNGIENSAGQRSADDRKKQKILTVAEHCRARKGARAKKLAEVEANGAKHADSDKAEAFPLFFYLSFLQDNHSHFCRKIHLKMTDNDKKKNLFHPCPHHDFPGKKRFFLFLQTKAQLSQAEISLPA